MQEPSHLPCPLCGKSDHQKDEYDYQDKLQRAIDNLKYLNLGFSIAYYMTDLERDVYYYKQMKQCTFKEMSVLLKKSESTLKKAWKRCKLRGDKALQESIW
jgi:hypothetical protein